MDKNQHIDLDDHFNEEESFDCCADCDLPDACMDFGCAKAAGLPRKYDGIQMEWDD